MAEYNMPQYILREFKVTDARVSAAQCAVCACEGYGWGWAGVVQTPAIGKVAYRKEGSLVWFGSRKKD